MKRLSFLLTLAAIIVALAAHAQSRKARAREAAQAKTEAQIKRTTENGGDLPLFVTKGKVKSIFEKHYFITNTEVKAALKDDEIPPETAMLHLGATRYDFTPAGYLSGYRLLDSAGQPINNDENPVLDDKGRLQAVTYSTGIGDRIHRELLTFERDSAGRLAKFDIVYKDQPKRHILTGTLKLRSDGTIGMIKQVFENDWFTTQYKYDRNGTRTTAEIRRPYGHATVTFIYAPTTDTHGNWLQARYGDEVTLRTIEYYD